MKLSIIVPIYNEEKTISNVLKKLLEVKITCQREIILVDDGSSDNTSKKIDVFLSGKKKEFIKSIRHLQNQGKGVAIRTGISNASGNYILIQDADLEYNPEEIPKLIMALKPNEAVYGSRFITKQVRIPKLYYIGNKFLTEFVNLLFSVRLTDMETGYKLVPSEFFKRHQIKSRRFDMEPEITAKLIKYKIKINEIPISYNGRDHLAGKKLTPLDAFEAIFAIVYYRFFN